MKSWIRSLVLVGTMAGVALAPLTEAHAALNAYLKLKGQKTGTIKGSVTQKGHSGDIRVIAVSHEIVSPRDAASGLPTGKRQHKPFVITKELDRSSPLLNQMLCDNESITEMVISYYDTNKDGEELLYTIKLTNASISSIKLVTTEDGKVEQQLTVTYEKVQWTWNDGGITAMDDWETRR